jgi:hypothetical protein
MSLPLIAAAMKGGGIKINATKTIGQQPGQECPHDHRQRAEQCEQQPSQRPPI